MRVHKLVVGLVLAAAASCGEPFAIVGGGGSTPTGGACSPADGNTCGAGSYCETTDCKTGTCKPVPAAAGSKFLPVCGCDHVIYWNADLAIASDASFVPSSACSASSITTCGPGGCSGHGADVYCSLRSPSMTESCDKPPDGVCVRIPSDCGSTTEGGQACGSGDCKTTCELIRAEKPWFVPQGGCTP
jgi:hypothetical protein